MTHAACAPNCDGGVLVRCSVPRLAAGPPPVVGDLVDLIFPASLNRHMDHSVSTTALKAFGNIGARPRIVGVYHPRHGWIVQSDREILTVAAACSLRASGVTYVNLKWKSRQVKLSLLKMDLPGGPAADPAHRSTEQLHPAATPSHWYATEPVTATRPSEASEAVVNRQRYTVTVTVEIEGDGADERQLLQLGLDALQSGAVNLQVPEIALAS